MENRILILEPYGSHLGHPIKNVDLFSDKTVKEKYKYEFITDRGVKKQNIQKYFMNARKFYDLSINERVVVRKNEFKELILKIKDSHLLFSTTLEWDIEAWLELFKEGIEDNLKRKNNILTIHSGFGMYYSFLKHKKLLKEIELSNVRFTFFSELQTYLMKKSYPSLIFGTLPFPVYGINSDSGGGEKEFISYVGVFSIYKNPFFILDLVKKLKNEKFFIHFYKIDESNYFLAREFFLLQNCKTNFSKLSKNSYKDILQKSKFGVLPYNRYEYSLRPSGIFEEYFHNGIPVFVPDGTWMSYTLRKYGLGETIYNGELTDLVEKLKKVKRNEDELKSKWKARAEKFRRKLSLDNFFRNLKEIYLKMNKNISVHEKEIIKRGLVNYYVNGAFYYFERGDNDFSKRLLSEIKEEPEDYRDYYYMKGKIKGEKPDKISYYTFWSQPLDKGEFIKQSLYSSIFSEDIERLRKELSSDENKKFLKNLKRVLNKSDYVEVFLIYIYYLTEVILKTNKISELSSVRSKVNYFYKNNSKNISNQGMFYLAKTYYLLGSLDKAEELFKSVLRRKINESLKTESYLILSNLYVSKEKYKKAEYYHKKYTKEKDLMFKFYFSIAQKIELKGRNPLFYYKKSLNILLREKNKNELDFYKIALLYKKIGNTTRAAKWLGKLSGDYLRFLFRKKFFTKDRRESIHWLSDTENFFIPRVKQPYFFLGEFYFELGNFKKAVKYLLISMEKEKLKRADDVKRLFLVAEAHLNFGNINKGKIYFIEAFSKLIKPNDPLSIYRKASIYKRLGNLEEAEKLFFKILKVKNNKNLKAGAYFHLGEIEIRKGRIKKGLDLLKKCLTKIPQHKKAKEYIIYYGERK